MLGWNLLSLLINRLNSFSSWCQIMKISAKYLHHSQGFSRKGFKISSSMAAMKVIRWGGGKFSSYSGILYSQADRKTEKQTGRDRLTDRQIDRQRDRETNR